MSRHQSSGKLVVTSIVCIALLAASLLLLLNRMVIRDWVIVSQFQPTNAVQQLAVDAGMNDEGKHYFYSGEPELKQSADFNSACGEHEPTTSVLGCYANYQIYLFDIDNEELHGIEEVTASHEMLHAAYDRLGQTDKASVNHMIEAFLPTLEKDETFVSRMNAYGDISHEDKLNELHSIIGTEVKNIPNDLEAYYKQYFADRSKTTSFYARYSNVFTALQDRSDLLATRYNQTVELRNQLVETSNREYRQLTADIQAFESGPRTNSSEARELNRRAAEYNARLDDVKRQLAEYDAQLAAIKAELDSIAIHTKKLNDSINSQVNDPAKGV